MASREDASKAVDAYIDRAPEFAKRVCRKLREIIRKAAPELEEVIRWGCPCFKGRGLVCGMGAFKEHVTLFFGRGAEVKDVDGLLTHGEGNVMGRSLKVSTLKEISEPKVRRLIQEAVKLDASDAMKAKPRAKRPELPMPPELVEALRRSPKAEANFEQLPPSCRREYIEWISSAKRAETKDRRLAEAVDMLEAGRRRNEQYR